LLTLRPAISSPIGKRKASDIVDVDDFENVDPTFFSKRSKGAASLFPSSDISKPSSFVLTKAAPIDASHASPTKPVASPHPRAVLQPKSPAAKINTSIAKSSPLSAPAGRSPTRGKRSGILSNRRRTAGPYTRVDPPSFSLGGAAAPFSLDAALKGTIPSYAARSAAPAPRVNEAFNTLHEPEMKASWFFDIHEDTPEQEMTNLLQHGTCVLDISSDEESEQKANRERAEGRDKENIPPADDVSQTAAAAAARRAARVASTDDMVFEKERTALGEMRAEDFYPAGCDESTVIIVPGDEDEAEQPVRLAELEAAVENAPLFEFAPEIKLEPLVESNDVDELMSKDEPALPAAVLEPMEGTGETFELWESGSAKDETEGMIVVTEEAR
jgi:hypothetical protein